MLSIKIDKELKEKAQEVAHALGVSLNAVINQNIKEFVSERQVTFSDHPVLNKKSQKIIDKLLIRFFKFFVPNALTYTKFSF